MRSKNWASAVILLTLLTPALCHAVDSFGDISITTISAPTTQSYHGYAEWSFMITNTSPKKTHMVSLQMPDRAYGYGDHIRSISRTVTVGPMATAKMSMFQPSVTMQGSNMKVYIDGRTQRDPVPVNFGHHGSNSRYYGGGARPVCVLLSKSVSFDDFAKGTSSVPGTSSGRSRPSGGNQVSFQRSEIALSQWSTDWLGYSKYDGVVLTAADMEKLPVTVKNAIYDYVQCGGTLLVLGSWNDVPSWWSATQNVGPFVADHYGFGLCIVDDTDTSTWDNKKWNTLLNSIWNQTAMPFMGNNTVKNANDQFPVVSNLKIPARGLLLLVVVFAVAMGPANLYILSKMKKRIWLLWTVPAISIVGSVAVFAYAMLAEGWGGIRRSETITILNEEDHKAATIGVCAFYSPLTPRGGLSFDYGTELSPITLQRNRGGRPRTFELTSGLNFNSGWISARVPAHFLVRKSETRRERVKLSIDQDGQISAVNGLGGDITALWYMDADGMVFKAENLPAGSKIRLAPSGSESEDKMITSRKVYSEANWTARFAGNDPRFLLRRNTYVAEIKESLFIEQGLENIKSDNSRSIVIGILKGELDAGSGS